MNLTNKTPFAESRLLEIMTAISVEKSLGKLLSTILSAARELTGAESGRIYILDPSGRKLIRQVTQNEAIDFSQEFGKNIELYEQGRPRSRDVVAYCAFSGSVVKVDDVPSSGAFDFSERLRCDQRAGYHTQSLLVAPLNRPEEFTVGVLELCNALDPHSLTRVAFKESQEQLVHAFASQAAVSINNARLLDENNRLITVLNESNKDLEQENRKLKTRIYGRCDFSDIVGNSAPMQRVFELVEKISNTDTNVLIQGETGTGKELIAQAIHNNGKRSQGQFVAQNCAALQEQLLESELFGYKKGAFTGAVADKPGLFDIAHKGTMFLDEVGDLPLSLQAKLLRVLQEGEFRPLGDVTTRSVDVRLLTATHHDLVQLVGKGEFREDLFYRLQVFPIRVPPLRERRDDIPALTQHFVRAFSDAQSKNVEGITPRALDVLMRYEFPGNVRELRNLLERAVILSTDGATISEEGLPSHLFNEDIKNVKTGKQTFSSQFGGLDLKERVLAFEAQVISEELARMGGNRTKTADQLGISRRTLQSKLLKLNVS